MKLLEFLADKAGFLAAIAALPKYAAEPRLSGEVRCVGSDTLREVIDDAPRDDEATPSKDKRE